MIDFSPLIHVVMVGSLKIAIAIAVFVLAYAAVFLRMKARVGRAIAGLAAQLCGGLSALGVIYVAFVVLGRP